MRSVILLLLLFCTLLKSTESSSSLCESNSVCEHTIDAENCSIAIETGLISTTYADYSLFDAPEGYGCTICIPPDRNWVGPDPCMECYCSSESSGVECSAQAGEFIIASSDALPCPESQYDFNDYVATERVDSCPTMEDIELELNCGGASDSSLPGPTLEPTKQLPLLPKDPMDSTMPTSSGASFATFGGILSLGALALLCVGH